MGVLGATKLLSEKLISSESFLNKSDDEVNKIGIKSVQTIDKKPHGNYAVDLKEDFDGNWHVTEIDSGKFHTTTPLWGYVSTNLLKQNPLVTLT